MDSNYNHLHQVLDENNNISTTIVLKSSNGQQNGLSERSSSSSSSSNSSSSSVSSSGSCFSSLEQQTLTTSATSGSPEAPPPPAPPPEQQQPVNNPNGPKPRGRRKKIRTEPIRPICPQCEKQFSNQSALTKHKLTHSDERKFACQQCSKAFKRHDHLTGHMQTHSNRKPFNCTIQGCDKTYCDARSLRRHKENIHHIVTPKDNNTNNSSSCSNNQQQHNQKVNNNSISSLGDKSVCDDENLLQQTQHTQAQLYNSSQSINNNQQQLVDNQQQATQPNLSHSHQNQHNHYHQFQPLNSAGIESSTGTWSSSSYLQLHQNHHHQHPAPYSADCVTSSQQRFSFDLVSPVALQSEQQLISGSSSSSNNNMPGSADSLASTEPTQANNFKLEQQVAPIGSSDFLSPTENLHFNNQAPPPSQQQVFGQQQQQQQLQPQNTTFLESANNQQPSHLYTRRLQRLHPDRGVYTEHDHPRLDLMRRPMHTMDTQHHQQPSFSADYAITAQPRFPFPELNSHNTKDVNNNQQQLSNQKVSILSFGESSLAEDENENGGQQVFGHQLHQPALLYSSTHSIGNTVQHLGGNQQQAGNHLQHSHNHNLNLNHNHINHYHQVQPLNSAGFESSTGTWSSSSSSSYSHHHHNHHHHHHHPHQHPAPYSADCVSNQQRFSFDFISPIAVQSEQQLISSSSSSSNNNMPGSADSLVSAEPVQTSTFKQDQQVTPIDSSGFLSPTENLHFGEEAPTQPSGQHPPPSTTFLEPTSNLYTSKLQQRSHQDQPLYSDHDHPSLELMHPMDSQHYQQTYSTEYATTTAQRSPFPELTTHNPMTIANTSNSHIL